MTDWPGTPVNRGGGGGQTLGQRGAQTRGPMAQRAQAQGASRVMQRQEQAGEREIDTANTSLQLLEGLARARRLIESDTPTGPMAEGAMVASRAAPEMMRGNLGLLSTPQLTNLGELDKLSTLAATSVAGATTTGMDAATREAVRGALFGVERSQGENRRNVNYLLQQYMNDAVGARVRQSWRARYSDVNAVDPATGMNAQDYIAALRLQLPREGDDFEHRQAYRTRVTASNGGSIDLPEVSSYIDSLVNTIRGERGLEGFKTNGVGAGKVVGNAAPSGPVTFVRSPDGRIVPQR